MAGIEDWMPPTPSPRTLMSSFLYEEFSSGPFLDLFGENGGEKPQDASEKDKAFACSKEREAQATNAPFQKHLSLEPSFLGAAHRPNSHGGLAERMAARAGFSIPKIDTSRVGLAVIASSSAEVRSPYVMIPPGLSPTTLLESPVFLSNSMAQPSPTTGKLPFALNNVAKTTLFSIPEKAKDQAFEDEAFSFQPLLESKPSSFSAADKDCSAFPHSSSANGKDISDETIPKQKTSDSLVGNDHASPADEQEDGETEQKGEYSLATVGAPAEDGYNWRKYGQKHVKNSEYPRSYYKCTHPNCPVKKKVERSHEGHVTEIIYKGAHNHPKPPPNRWSGVSISHPFNDPQVDAFEITSSQSALNPASFWGSAQNGSLKDMQSEGMEAKPSASASEFGDASLMESQDVVDVSSTLSNEEDDRATHGTVTLDCDGDEDETESKRRKLDATAIEMASTASRAVREPRVVVQTTSEVDILDDGYRWRKYGQKVVKGNPNPRSYYKCTHPGCSVRKHVERASHDLKSVITTYEGKHNHEVPAARNSGHPSSASGAAPQSHGLHRRAEPAQDSLATFCAATPFSGFGLPPRDQLGPTDGFSFGMIPPGLGHLPMPALGPIPPPKMVRHPLTMQAYLGHQQARDAALLMPKGEPKEEPGFPASNTASMVYQQMMSRLPLGPQM